MSDVKASIRDAVSRYSSLLKREDVRDGFWHHSKMRRRIKAKLEELASPKLQIGMVRGKALEAREFCAAVIRDHRLSGSVLQHIREEPLFTEGERAELSAEFTALINGLVGVGSDLDSGLQRLSEVDVHNVHYSRADAHRITSSLAEAIERKFDSLDRHARNVESFLSRWSRDAFVRSLRKTA